MTDTNFRRYEDTITGEIVSYPEDAAALFDHLKLVPSERAKDKVAVQEETNADDPAKKGDK